MAYVGIIYNKEKEEFDWQVFSASEEANKYLGSSFSKILYDLFPESYNNELCRKIEKTGTLTFVHDIIDYKDICNKMEKDNNIKINPVFELGFIVNETYDEVKEFVRIILNKFTFLSAEIQR